MNVSIVSGFLWGIWALGCVSCGEVLGSGVGDESVLGWCLCVMWASYGWELLLQYEWKLLKLCLGCVQQLEGVCVTLDGGVGCEDCLDAPVNVWDCCWGLAGDG